jgi:transposase-like protein
MSKKRVKSNVGERTPEIPRDRQGTFDPVVVKKLQSTLPTFQNTIIPQLRVATTGEYTQVRQNGRGFRSPLLRF